METTFFKVDKKVVFLQLFENLSNKIHVSLAHIIDIDENII